MDGIFLSENRNASIRGYVMRSLVKGQHFSLPVKVISNKMLSCGLISNPDIADHLYYLKGYELIEFTDRNVTSLTLWKQMQLSG